MKRKRIYISAALAIAAGLSLGNAHAETCADLPRPALPMRA
jgi:hypothetical protein